MKFIINNKYKLYYERNIKNNCIYSDYYIFYINNINYIRKK